MFPHTMPSSDAFDFTSRYMPYMLYIQHRLLQDVINIAKSTYLYNVTKTIHSSILLNKTMLKVRIYII